MNATDKKAIVEIMRSAGYAAHYGRVYAEHTRPAKRRVTAQDREISGIAVQLRDHHATHAETLLKEWEQA